MTIRAMSIIMNTIITIMSASTIMSTIMSMSTEGFHANCG